MSVVKLQDVADELGKPVATILREAHSAELAVWVPAQALQEQLDRELKAPTSGSEDEIFGGVYRELGLRNRYRFRPMRAVSSESLSTEAIKLPQLPVPAWGEGKIREFEEIGEIVGWQWHAEVCSIEDQANRLFSLLPLHQLEIRSKNLIKISHLGALDSQESDTVKIINWFPFCQFKVGVESLVIKLADEEWLMESLRSGKTLRKKTEPVTESIDQCQLGNPEQKQEAIFGEIYKPLRDLLFRIANDKKWHRRKRVEAFWVVIRSELGKEKLNQRKYDNEEQILLQWDANTDTSDEKDRAFFWKDAKGRERRCARATLANYLTQLARHHKEFKSYQA